MEAAGKSGLGFRYSSMLLLYKTRERTFLSFSSADTQIACTVGIV